MKKLLKIISVLLCVAMVIPLAASCGKKLSYSGSALTPGRVGEAYSDVSVATATGSDSITYTRASGSLPDGLTLSENGKISGTPTVKGTFTFTVTASADGYDSADADFSITVAQPALSYSSVVLVSGEVGTEYCANGGVAVTVATATGTGSPVISYERKSGNLPGGLTLNSNGTITGTPTATGTFTFTVTASADGYDSADAVFSISISLPALSYAAADLAEGKVGIEYRAEGGDFVTAATATGADSITYTRTSGNLPAGLTLNGDGTITGSPTATGTFTFTVTASADGYSSANAQFSITVVKLGLLYDGGILASGKIEAVYAGASVATATAPEGNPTLRYELASGNLPDGLMLNNETGAITGTPDTLGTFVFIITASDTNSYYTSANAEFTISIAPSIRYTGRDIATKIGTQYSGSVADAAVLGVTVQPTITYSLKNSTLPLGLTLNSDGTITGTPTVTTATPVSFTVTASAEGCDSVDAEFTITVSDQDIINYISVPLPNGKITVAYRGAGDSTVTVATATALGDPVITYTRASGNLPTGLTLNSNGTITGTPTALGTFTFTVTASADGYSSNTAAFSITIGNLGVITYTGKTLVGGTQGEEYAGDSVGTATGAPSSSLSYTLQSGSLPNGLELNKATGEIAGTPSQSGSFSFRITASAENYTSASADFTLEVAAAAVSGTTYYFEAEYILLEWSDADGEPLKRQGCAYSGGGPGYGMLYEDIEKSMMISQTESVTKNGNARTEENNGYFITSMYERNAFIDFEIVSDRAVSNAELSVALSVEFFAKALRLAPNNTTIGGAAYWGFLFETIHLGSVPYDHINNPYDSRLDYGDPGYMSNIIDYEPIVITNNYCSTPGDPIEDFKEYTISMNVSLCAGYNIIRLRTNNNAKIDGSGGGMGAVAPMVDYIKIVSDAQLSWHKKFESNLEFANQ